MRADESLARRAAVPVERFALTAMAAIHLAAAERVAEAVAPHAFSFVSFDRRQIEAAIDLGLRVPLFLRAGTARD